MAVYERENFANQRIVVDGNRYVQCSFVDCVLIFRGGELPTLDRCRFSSVGITLEGAAEDTLDYLAMLSGVGLFSNVDGVVKSVKTGMLPITSRPLPCDARNTGSNYRQLGIVSAVLAGITLILIAAIWYGFIYYPNEEVLGGENPRPLEAEIPLDIMPVLPENLAASYDQHLDDQGSLLGSYGWADEEAGIARIPIDISFDIIVEQGLPTWSATGR